MQFHESLKLNNDTQIQNHLNLISHMYTKLKLSRMNGVGYGRNEKCKQNFRENLKGTDQYKDFFFMARQPQWA
jgi:hypothetical protein